MKSAKWKMRNAKWCGYRETCGLGDAPGGFFHRGGAIATKAKKYALVVTREFLTGAGGFMGREGGI
jgi:hypothetical protein